MKKNFFNTIDEVVIKTFQKMTSFIMTNADFKIDNYGIAYKLVYVMTLSWFTPIALSVFMWTIDGGTGWRIFILFSVTHAMKVLISRAKKSRDSATSTYGRGMKNILQFIRFSCLISCSYVFYLFIARCAVLLNTHENWRIGGHHLIYLIIYFALLLTVPIVYFLSCEPAKHEYHIPKEIERLERIIAQ